MRFFLAYIVIFSICAQSLASYRSDPDGLFSSSSNHSTDINRETFYHAMQGDDKILVNEELNKLKKESGNIPEAYLGALLMKKAGLGGAPVAKLQLFKEGHRMLENAIRQDPDNAEYHFLRLMIQEHAPGVLGYKNDMEKDSKIVRKAYKSLPGDLQPFITEYNKKSKILKLEVS